jgi:hypothetical protein
MTVCVSASQPIARRLEREPRGGGASVAQQGVQSAGWSGYGWVLPVSGRLLGWANEAARVLRSQISTSDIARLVLTKRYELLLSMIARVSAEVDHSQMVKSFY